MNERATTRRACDQRTTRRVFLRSAQWALALPFFASWPVRSEESGKRISAIAGSQESLVKPPLRFACIFFSNGVEPAHWWARGAGSSMVVGPGLAPMQPFVEDLVFLKGLYNAQADAHKSVHLGRIANLLSGSWVSTEQDTIRCGLSMDQLLAQRLGNQTAVQSLVLGIEPTELRLEDGLSMLYGSAISWSSPTKPAMKEIYPSRVFDRLMGSAADRAVDASILDGVLQESQQLRPTLAASDRVKLDEYLESIRDIELRLQRAQNEERLEGWRPTLSEPNLPRPAESLPQDIPGHMKLMLDLIILAFQMDKTRIATCMLNNDLSQMNFGFLEGVQGSLHLDLTHNGRDPQREAMYLKTNQFHVQQFAYLVDRLKKIDEGDSSLLDNSLLLACSNLFDGDRHQADEMPMLVAGRGGGSVTPGRVLDYRDRGDDRRRACSLYLSMMERFGVHVERFGDADTPLEDF